MKDPMNIRGWDPEREEEMEEFYRLQTGQPEGWNAYQYMMAAGWGILIILLLLGFGGA